MRRIEEIIVHCSATPPEWFRGKPLADKMKEIDRWHKERGFSPRGNPKWRFLGYHGVIDRDGSALRGRPEEISGAHCRGRNAKSLGVCLIGGYESLEDDSFDTHFTPEQETALRNLIDSWVAFYRIDEKNVRGHNEFSRKACPGFNVREWRQCLKLDKPKA